MAKNKQKRKPKMMEGENIANLEIGDELGGGTQQQNAQINQLRKKKKK